MAIFRENKLAKKLIVGFEAGVSQLNLLKLRLSGVDATNEQFELICQKLGLKPIYHVTSDYCFFKIISDKRIYGIDVVSSAHFHGNSEQAMDYRQDKTCVLGFSWAGPMRETKSSKTRFSHGEKNPDVLYCAPYTESKKSVWEYRLYPGTKHFLELRFVQIGTLSILKKVPLPIVVTDSP